jgi:hypothetical protein
VGLHGFIIIIVFCCLTFHCDSRAFTRNLIVCFFISISVLFKSRTFIPFDLPVLLGIPQMWSQRQISAKSDVERVSSCKFHTPNP